MPAPVFDQVDQQAQHLRLQLHRRSALRQPELAIIHLELIETVNHLFGLEPIARNDRLLQAPLHRTSKLKLQFATPGYRQFTTTSIGWATAFSDCVATRNRWPSCDGRRYIRLFSSASH